MAGLVLRACYQAQSHDSSTKARRAETSAEGFLWFLLKKEEWEIIMLSNYPPGAANDPEAPYNQPLDEDEELALLQAIYYPKKDKKKTLYEQIRNT